MSIQEMKQAVADMPPDERAEFAAWLNEHWTEQPRPVTFEDIKHLVGIGKGPGDLATNPNYMDDYGQGSMS